LIATNAAAATATATATATTAHRSPSSSADQHTSSVATSSVITDTGGDHSASGSTAASSSWTWHRRSCALLRVRPVTVTSAWPSTDHGPVTAARQTVPLHSTTTAVAGAPPGRSEEARPPGTAHIDSGGKTSSSTQAWHTKEYTRARRTSLDRACANTRGGTAALITPCTQSWAHHRPGVDPTHLGFARAARPTCTTRAAPPAGSLLPGAGGASG
jgi:hypothetical protein